MSPVDNAVELIQGLIIIVVLLYVLLFMIDALFISLPFI